ncbi:MAG: glycoside hydrolase family 15 protein [Phycisphaerae bacterium]|nr:glycoside hydrolase family 15 protein [Phycisphaerae bacterium]
MARDIPVSNGSLLVTFDRWWRILDFYFPHVGQENHNEGSICRFGVWCDGEFAWMGPDWQVELDYETETLVTDVVARHKGLGIEIRANDCVDFHRNIFLRRLLVCDTAGRSREVRLFFCHDFNIYGTKVGDTAFYDPETGSVIHYKGKRYFLTACSAESPEGPIRQYACGHKGRPGYEGVWRDAEDGILGGNPIAKGTVDSAIAVHLDLPADGRREAFYWIAAATRYQEVAEEDRRVHTHTPAALIQRTRTYWRLWASKEEFSFAGVPDEIVNLFRRSQLILRTQIDNDGAIIAANDSAIVSLTRDTYSYCWPRDGAMCAYALIKAGHSGIPRHFFSFCAKVLHRDGYFLHKYNPDGSLASSWHPWIYEGQPQLPIQEDETALVLWALWAHFDRFRDIEYIKPLYRPFIMNMAEFMVTHRDAETGLPLPCHDLWEERWGVHTWTVATVIVGLCAAAKFSAAFGETELAEKFQNAAEEIRTALVKHLYSEAEGRFARSAQRTADGYRLDMTVDSSLCGLVLFDVFPADDPRVVSTLQAVRDRLAVKTDVGGIARYENDTWQRVPDSPAHVPGNPWFVPVAWLVQCDIAAAKTSEELDEALKKLRWVCRWALKSGVLAEQIHPLTGKPLGVSPLSWSHAEIITTVVDYLEKRAWLRELSGEVFHLHNRGRYAGRFNARHCWDVDEES